MKITFSVFAFVSLLICLFSCEKDDSINNDFYQTNFIKQIYLSLFASILGVGLTAFYYMLRPSDTELFRFWWKRGRYVVMVMFLCAFITTIMTMSMAGWVLNGWYVVSTKGFCDSPGDFTFSRQFATAGITINFLVLLTNILGKIDVVLNFIIHTKQFNSRSCS